MVTFSVVNWRRSFLANWELGYNPAVLVLRIIRSDLPPFNFRLFLLDFPSAVSVFTVLLFLPVSFNYLFVSCLHPSPA